MKETMVRFADRKASNKFMDVCEMLKGQQKKEFKMRAATLYDKKLVSAEGEYREFTLTESDIVGILKEMHANA